jgi:hypothetical protein
VKVTLVDWLGVRVKEKVPLRVKGLFEGGYASRWVRSCEGEEEGMVKGGGIDEGEVDREEGEVEPGEEEGLRSPSSILVEGALVELAGEDSSEAAMYWSTSGMMVGFTAALSELSPGQ